MPRRNKTQPHVPLRSTNRCADKRRFRSENEARKAADFQMLLKPSLELDVYHCDLCGGWHLTRQIRTR